MENFCTVNTIYSTYVSIKMPHLQARSGQYVHTHRHTNTGGMGASVRSVLAAHNTAKHEYKRTQEINDSPILFSNKTQNLALLNNLEKIAIILLHSNTPTLCASGIRCTNIIQH